MTDFADVIQMLQFLLGSGMTDGDMMGGDMMSPDDMYMDGDITFESTPTMSDDLVFE